MEPLFASQADYDAFTERHSQYICQPKVIWLPTKATVSLVSMPVPPQQKLLWSVRMVLCCIRFYSNNNGSPLATTIRAMQEIYSQLPDSAQIAYSCSTGYGEALIKAALMLDEGEVETVSHYYAAAFFDPKVDCILDIGGQDMKCIKIKNQHRRQRTVK